MKNDKPLSKKQNPALQLLRHPFKWLFDSTLANSIGLELSAYGLVIAVYGIFGWFIGGSLGEIIGNDWMPLITGTTFILLHFALILTSKELGQA